MQEHGDIRHHQCQHGSDALLARAGKFAEQSIIQPETILPVTGQRDVSEVS